MINEISQKIKLLRKQQDMTLKELSERSSFSVSFLSQVENGTSSLAIMSLKKIAEALNVPIIYFFQEHEEHKYHVSKKEQKSFRIEGSPSAFIRVSGDFPNRTLETIIVTLAPETEHGQPMTHPGEEFVFVLEGEVVVTLDDTDYHVTAGETMHYPSTISHHWRNPLKSTTRILSTTSNTIF
jgi:transcriptional regulator with XRE-family HTH domain